MGQPYTKLVVSVIGNPNKEAAAENYFSKAETPSSPPQQELLGGHCTISGLLLLD